MSDWLLCEAEMRLHSLVYQGLIALAGLFGLRLKALDNRVVHIDRDAGLSGRRNNRAALAFGKVIQLFHSFSFLSGQASALRWFVARRAWACEQRPSGSQRHSFQW